MNVKQQRFLAEYLKDSNATQAAIRAGYSAKSAGKIGDRLSKKAEIRAAIDAKLAEVGMSADNVLRNLSALASFDPADFYKEDGSLKSIHEIPVDTRKAMAGLEVDELFEGRGQEQTQVGWTKKIKFTDRIRALELIGKRHKLFTDKIEHEAGETFADLVLRAQRVREGKAV